MIVYLATYPRSGNTFLQRVARKNFGYLPTQIKAPIKKPEVARRVMLSGGGDFELADSDFDSFVVPARLRGGEWRRVLLHCDLTVLTPEFRRSLSEEPDFFFVKTHDLPFESYFDGEYVIQAVRHPGAVVWSYFRYLNDFVLPKIRENIFKAEPFTLDTVIRGNVQFGSWSSYHNKWKTVSASLGARFLSLQFELMTADQDATFRRISDTLSLPITSSSHMDFSAFQRRFPGRDLRGLSDGYEMFYSAPQLDRLWQEHGETAKSYGYEPPDGSLAAPDEQVRRLETLVRALWEQHRAERLQPSA